MKGIIIAAGSCTRLRPLTDKVPKCLLKINGKPIIENTLDLFKKNGIDDISIIRGYKKEKINFPEITYFENSDFENNNILHSLISARKKIEEAIKENEDLVITYSDIWFENSVVKSLVESEKDISAIVDIQWKDYYTGRTDHPISEAENVIMDGGNRIIKIGKHIITDDIPENKQGEFIGLWKFSREGSQTFLKHFDLINSILEKQSPFQNAKEWQKSYITDIFQEMVDKGEKLHCVITKKNWMEFDTVQDFLRAGGETV